MTKQVDLLEEAKRNFPYIVTHLLGEPNQARSRGLSDTRYGRKGSLSIDFKQCIWRSFETGNSGGVYDFIKEAAQLQDNKQVTAWLKENFLNSGNGNPLPPIFQNKDPNNTYTQAAAQRKAQYKSIALDIFNNAEEAIGTPVEKYLVGRGIKLKSYNDIRYTRGKLPLEFQNTGGDHVVDYDIMVALYRDIETNEPLAIHRTYLAEVYLDSDWTRSRYQVRAKANLGSSVKGVIKLSDDADVYDSLHVTEGIETALTALSQGYAPTWALGDCGTLHNLEPIPGINNLVIFADNDKDGQGLKSAENCRVLWGERNVKIFIPKQSGHDLNDKLKEVISQDEEIPYE